MDRSKPIDSGIHALAGETAPAAPARDGRIAELEEFNLAMGANTVAALDLFLARHPHSIHADAARKARERLIESK